MTDMVIRREIWTRTYPEEAPVTTEAEKRVPLLLQGRNTRGLQSAEAERGKADSFSNALGEHGRGRHLDFRFLALSYSFSQCGTSPLFQVQF